MSTSEVGLFAVATMLGMIGLSGPATAGLAESEVGAPAFDTCSTCDGGFFSHSFLQNCCMPGSDGCRLCGPNGCHTDAVFTWCWDHAHGSCPEQ